MLQCWRDRYTQTYYGQLSWPSDTNTLHLLQSMDAKYSKDYPRAKDCGKYSLLFTTINIVFTLLFAMLIIGLTVGLYDGCYYHNKTPYIGGLICTCLDLHDCWR